MGLPLSLKACRASRSSVIEPQLMALAPGSVRYSAVMCLSSAAALMACTASMRPTLLPSPKDMEKPVPVRSPLILPRSTFSTVLSPTMTVLLLSILPSDTTMDIIIISISSPLTTDTITTPSALASIVAPKLNGFLSIF